jgi:peptidoglycan/xylan/chitin deacetylase (PgdA/CDA1 family)
LKTTLQVMKLPIESFRRVARWLWANLLMTLGCLWWAKRQLRASGAIIPLVLHRVLGEAEYPKTHSLPGILIREGTFRELVAYVVRRCAPVDLRNAEPGKPSSRIRVAFTFDDGWIDNYLIAFPITHAHEIPVIIFLCPGLIDKASPFWPEMAIALIRAIRTTAKEPEVEAAIEDLKRQSTAARTAYLAKLSEELLRDTGRSVGPSSVDRTVSWSAVLEMDRGGVNFGSHTQTHQILPSLPLDAARKEIRESRAAIETALDKPCDIFAYPNGNWSSETRRLLMEEGFRLAFTTERGVWTENCDRLAIPRSNISEDNVVGPRGRFSPTMFEYTTFWKSWRATKAKSPLEFRPDQQPTPATL